MTQKQLHVCIHGAGGLGSVIGGYLAKAGQRVTLIGRPAHVAAIKQHGLKISGVRGDFTIRENLSAVDHPNQVEGDIDYYILLTKAKGSKQALADAKILVNRTACAMSLQNGVGKEAALEACFDAGKVIGASAMESGFLTAPGHALNKLTVPITAYFGELKGGESDRTRIFTDAMTACGLGSKSVADINHVLWEKVVQVGGASAWTASALAGNPKLDFTDGLSVRESVQHYLTIAKEFLAVYRALGYAPQDFYAPVSWLRDMDKSTFEEAVAIGMAKGELLAKAGQKGVRTSMHEDVLAGRKSEVDEVIGPIIEAAARLGVPVPTGLGAYRVIKALDHFAT